MKKEDFTEILKNYDLGQYKSNKQMLNAHSGEVYLINTTKGKFILKSFNPHFRINSKLLSFRATNYLNKKGILVPHLILNNSKKLVSDYKEKKISVKNYIEGKSVKELTNIQTIELAKMVGKINLYLKELTPRTNKIASRGTITKLLKNNFLKVQEIEVQQKKEQLLENIKKLDKSRLKISLLHRDIRGDNTIVHKGKVAAIIDWDMTGYDYISYDLGVLLHGFFLRPRIKENQIKLFLKEYQKYIKFNEEEKKATYYFMLQRIIEVVGFFQWKYSQTKNSEYIKRNYYLMKSYLELEKFGLDKFIALFKT
ncbi:phosphotransferase [Candidatus Pacearchaeota archaeon]|nr:phosphotransferase [Candidatus Pacearchaeota archaeon]